MKRYDYRGWHIAGEDGRHPVTGCWRAESYGVTMSSSTEVTIRQMVDIRCEEYPPSGHGPYTPRFISLGACGNYELFQRRVTGEFHLQRWTEKTAYQMSIAYPSEQAAREAAHNTVEWTPA